MKQKKGQISSLQGIIATVVIVGLLIAAAFMIMNEFQEVDVFSSYSYSASNETGAWGNSTGYPLDKADDPGFNSATVTAAWNTSDGTEIVAGNFTVDRDGSLTNTTVIEYLAIQIDYSYNRGETGYVALNDTILAFTTIPELLGLIILIVMVGLVLAIIFSIIPGARTSGA